MIEHCNLRFRPDEIWYLKDNELFVHRRIEIGTCPVCEHFLVKLVERRRTDDKLFVDIYRQRKAKRCLKEHESDIFYSSLDCTKPQTKCLYGFRYGENKERFDKKTGKTIITQKACDFYGNKEVIDKFQC